MSQRLSERREQRRSGSAAGVGHRRPRIVVGIREMAFHQEVLDFLERDPRIEVSGAGSEANGIVKFLAESPPEAMVVCPMVLSELRHPVAADRVSDMVVVTEEITVPVLREAIDARARAVFAWPNERAELADTLARVATGEGFDAGRRGVVSAVFGARGGAGATFVASHVAASLADQGVPAALVDLDGDFAGLTVALGIEPKPELRTVADLLPVMDELGPDHVRDALYRHPRGFQALLGPPEGFGEAIPAGLYRGAIALLATEFRAVVLHAPRALDDAVRAGLGLADEVLLVTTQDLFSLYGARRAMAALGLTADSGRCKVVVNRLARSQVTPADIARILGIPPAATVRFDGAVRRVQDRGELLPRRGGRAGRDIRSLARVIARWDERDPSEVEQP